MPGMPIPDRKEGQPCVREDQPAALTRQVVSSYREVFGCAIDRIDLYQPSIDACENLSVAALNISLSEKTGVESYQNPPLK